MLAQESFYWPYLALLPTEADQQMVPTQWDQEAAEARLAPSHLVPMLQEYRQRMRRTFDSIRTVAPITAFFDRIDAEYGVHKKYASNVEEDTAEDTGTAAGNGITLSWDNYQWAQAILDSRSIWWDGSRHLVPMLDFVNCVEGPDASRVHSTDTDTSEKFAVTAASWAFAEGEQLFENYGQPNYIYFMYHGFALPIGGNSNDCFYHIFTLSQEERERLVKNELIQSIASQVGFDRSPDYGVCIGVEGRVKEANHRTCLPPRVCVCPSLTCSQIARSH